MPEIDIPQPIDLTPENTIPHIVAGLAWWPVIAVLVLLLMINVAAHRTGQRLYMFWAIGGSVVVLSLGRLDGSSWTDLGMAPRTWVSGLVWGLACMALIFVVYAVGSSWKRTRNTFGDQNIAVMSRFLVYWKALVELPFGTVMFEEIAFRAVLWSMLARRMDVWQATLIAALLFGLWHILPSLDLHLRNPALSAGKNSRVAQLTAIAGSVVTTSIGALVFTALRVVSGSILAPMGMHWATNGWGYLFARRVTARKDVEGAQDA